MADVVQCECRVFLCVCVYVCVWVFPGGGSGSAAFRGLNACVICVSWVCVSAGKVDGVVGKVVTCYDVFFFPIHGFQSKDLHEALISD